ncbi:tryptophanyl-tRNA synthetase [Capronia coronata CBS 617.96]|uniref:tryptophan--tRNA ligase n=1 Tax=Capronia coronata CBS 617.96 TaxID=1182541 RepID=W9YD60_9EURO|nr:tryptophanyl-tRNA synthetase [Capronia coronata CBS 617.96]EXJ80264.1 tryptophanyl-tRNA synthetase [Capronia coronata CBS 617.96]
MPPRTQPVLLRSLTSRKVQKRHFSQGLRRADQTWGEKEDLDTAWMDERTSSNERVPLHKTRRVFSGIQPTGVPHLGNYLGALRQWKRFHDQSTDPNFSINYEPEQYFSVVDLHSLTGDIAPQDRLRLRKESFASLLAMGLHNTAETTVFFQSDVWCHSELMWILSTFASTGYLSRMTQWKSKLNLPDTANLDSDEATAKLKLGLFSYPVLQAADILLYRASMVPVGEDQLQHIEFTRSLARTFNSHVQRVGSGQAVFRIPWPVLSPAKRIMSLKRPTQKMSKSDPDPKSRILITDSKEDIYAKVKGAVTDSEPGISFDPERRPGVSNLIEILKHVTESNQPSQFIAKDLENTSMRAFKEMVAGEIVKALDGIRDNFLELMQPNNSRLHDEVFQGGWKARDKAKSTLQDVKQSLGLQTLALPWLEKERQPRKDSRPERVVRKEEELDSPSSSPDQFEGAPIRHSSAEAHVPIRHIPVGHEKRSSGRSGRS